jgi:hypothetical protein
MKDIATRLTILHDDGTDFTDLSDSLCDFGQDDETVELLAGGFIYLGYHKPISSFFVLLKTSNDTAAAMSVQISNGVSFADVEFLDDTRGLTRSGHVQLTLPEVEDMGAQEIDGRNLHWTRLALSTDSSEMDITGISGLFSDDRDLVREFRDIMDQSFLLGATSHVLIHESVRDEIVQIFRNRGLRTEKANLYRRLNFWDILDVQEVRLAACYLALARIFENVANYDKDDNWRKKSYIYQGKFDKAIQLAWLTYDATQTGDTKQINDITVGVLSR